MAFATFVTLCSTDSFTQLKHYLLQSRHVMENKLETKNVLISETYDCMSVNDVANRWDSCGQDPTKMGFPKGHKCIIVHPDSTSEEYVQE